MCGAPFLYFHRQALDMPHAMPKSTVRGKSIPAFLWSMALAAMAWGCQSPAQQNAAPAPAPPKMESATVALLPSGFDVRVFADPADADTGARVTLVTEIDIPEGAYVISALSDRDYLGKFQTSWANAAIQPIGSLLEYPRSMPGWEPFDRVFTPMLTSNTVIRQDWAFPAESAPHQGRIFFVLEPQCVPYALDFTLEKDPYGWSTSFGEPYAAQPEQD